MLLRLFSKANPFVVVSHYKCYQFRLGFRLTSSSDQRNKQTKFKCHFVAVEETLATLAKTFFLKFLAERFYCLF